jgi:hypothetical protein
MKWREAAEHCKMRSFINCTHHHILLGRANQVGGDGQERWEEHKIFWSEEL